MFFNAAVYVKMILMRNEQIFQSIIRYITEEYVPNKYGTISNQKIDSFSFYFVHKNWKVNKTYLKFEFFNSAARNLVNIN